MGGRLQAGGKRLASLSRLGVSCKPGAIHYLFNGRKLAAVFRGRMLAAMAAAGLTLPLTPKKRVVQCQHVGRGRPALKYLSRYLYRGVISNNNILKDDGTCVTSNTKTVTQAPCVPAKCQARILLPWYCSTPYPGALGVLGTMAFYMVTPNACYALCNGCYKCLSPNPKTANDQHLSVHVARRQCRSLAFSVPGVHRDRRLED